MRLLYEPKKTGFPHLWHFIFGISQGNVGPGFIKCLRKQKYENIIV